MNDDPRELRRRLEQATARAGSDESPLEPETAALRAGWLALGELLEAEQRSSPPRPLGEGPGVRAAGIGTRLTRRRRWLPIAIAALAASLLIAVSVTWHARGLKPATVPSTQPSDFAQNGAKPDAAVNDGSTAAGDLELAWDSSLDREIEQAGQKIMQLRQDQLASAAVSDRLQYQLEDLSKDLEESPL